MFMEMKTSCPRTTISVDHRHQSHYYCRAHIQLMSNLSAWIVGGLFPSLYEGERAPPVCPVLFFVGLHEERSRKVEKALQVNFEMYQVYILSIHPSIHFLPFNEQLNVLVYTQINRKV